MLIIYLSSIHRSIYMQVLFFSVCVYLYCCWRSNYQREWDPINRLNSARLPHFCVCSKPTPGFLIRYMSWPFRVRLRGVRGDCSFFFFYIGEIVDHHCLSYIFIESNIHIMKKKIYKQTKSANSDCRQFQQ